jgi:hypothetical protein
MIQDDLREHALREDPNEHHDIAETFGSRHSTNNRFADRSRPMIIEWTPEHISGEIFSHMFICLLTFT